MAFADYALCNCCGCKAFYDACFTDDRYLEAYQAGRMKVICEECAETYTVEVLKRKDEGHGKESDGGEACGESKAQAGEDGRGDLAD